MAADADARAVNRERIEAWIKVRGAWPGALLAPVTKGGRVLQRAMTAQAVLMRLRTIAARAGVRPCYSRRAAAHLWGYSFRMVRWVNAKRRLQPKCQPL